MRGRRFRRGVELARPAEDCRSERLQLDEYPAVSHHRCMSFARLHHMQLAMPKGKEKEARDFFGGVLGMEEVDKPPVLAARGGAWFRAGDVELHLGVEDEFRPARKAHPGMLVTDLDDVVQRLADAGQIVRWDSDFPGFRRVYARDPFDNRLEFLQLISH